MINGNYKAQEGNRDLLHAIECEWVLHHTMNDAEELIAMIGIRSFLENLYKDKKGRELTIEEMEAMQTLHDSWEL